jgi:hypothetical protein
VITKLKNFGCFFNTNNSNTKREQENLEQIINFNNNNNDYQFYFLVWLNENTNERHKSHKMFFRRNMEINYVLKWFLCDGQQLMNAKINIYIYLVNLKTGIEHLYAQNSFQLGEVYFYQPIGISLPMHDFERVKHKYIFA